VTYFAVCDFVDAYGFGLKFTEVKEHQLKRKFVCAPQRVIRSEANVAILIVGQRRQFRRRFDRGGLIRTLGLLLRARGDVVERESRRGPARHDAAQQRRRQNRRARKDRTDLHLAPDGR
jgi:hypothetical protein